LVNADYVLLQIYILFQHYFRMPVLTLMPTLTLSLNPTNPKYLHFTHRICRLNPYIPSVAYSTTCHCILPVMVMVKVVIVQLHLWFGLGLAVLPNLSHSEQFPC